MATYYIKNSGNDANTGLSDAQAWTFAKLETFVPANGDVILFNRGETFFGTLILLKSGISGSGITYGAYGTGSDPIISSLKTLTGWTNHSGNIWKVSSGIPANCGIVTINDVTVEMGHWPATGFAVWDTNVGITSITDADLPSSPNFTGAELVLYKSNWTIDRSLVTDHTNHTLTYTSGSAWAMQSTGGNKYLIQNSLACLTYHGSWFCDGSFFYIYLDTAPTNYVIKAGSADYTISLDRKNFNIIQDLTIEGGNLSAHYCLSSTYHQILRCTIKNAGIAGITGITNGVTGASTNTWIEDCTIKHIGGSGAWVNSAGSTVKGNLFEDCGEFAGMGEKGGGSHYGIYIKGIGNITEYNRFNRIGYIPINFYSNNSIVRYNVISNHTKLGLDDGGAIYTYYGIEDTAQSGIKVHNNIIFDPLNGNGLYLDNLSNNQEWYNNTIIGVTKWPIHCNMPQLNNIHDNVAFGCGIAGIDLSNLLAQATTANLNTIINNIFIQTSSGQKMYSLRDDRSTNDILNFGSSNTNTFVVSDAEASLFYNQKGSASSPPYTATSYNFINWKALTGKEAASNLLVKDLSKLSIKYNDTNTEITIPLATPKKDLSGSLYLSSVTLQPFTSIVLEEAGNEISYQVDSDGKYLTDNQGNYLYQQQ